MRSGGRPFMPSLTPDHRRKVRSTEPPIEPPCYGELRPSVRRGDNAPIFRDEPNYGEYQMPQIHPILKYNRVPVPPSQPRPKVMRPGAARNRRIRIPKSDIREIPTAWGPTSPTHGIPASVATRGIPVEPHHAMGYIPGFPRGGMPMPMPTAMAANGRSASNMGHGAFAPHEIDAAPHVYHAMPEAQNVRRPHALPSLRDLAGGERSLPSFREVRNASPIAVVGDGDATLRGFHGIQSAGHSLNTAQVLPRVLAPTHVLEPQPMVRALFRLYISCKLI